MKGRDFALRQRNPGALIRIFFGQRFRAQNTLVLLLRVWGFGSGIAIQIAAEPVELPVHAFNDVFRSGGVEPSTGTSQIDEARAFFFWSMVVTT